MEDDDLPPKGPTRAKKIRTAIAVALALACAAGSAWVRWGMKKEGLGGPCAYKMHCGDDAPTCLRENADDLGVCSRMCETGLPCAPGIACVSVDLDERDERGRPLKGGYCVPEGRLHTRKKGGAASDAGAAMSHVVVPSVPSQLEGEVELKWERPHAPARTAHYLVKGTLARTMPAGSTRTVADSGAMRLFTVHDDTQSFAATALEGGSSPDGPKVAKTGASDNVAGETCEVWRVEEPRAVHEVCVVMGGAFVEPTARLATAWQRELAVRSAFALRAVERDAKGNERARMTVTRLARRPLEASLFEVPRAYKNLAGR